MATTRNHKIAKEVQKQVKMYLNASSHATGIIISAKQDFQSILRGKYLCQLIHEYKRSPYFHYQLGIQAYYFDFSQKHCKQFSFSFKAREDFIPHRQMEQKIISSIAISSIFAVFITVRAFSSSAHHRSSVQLGLSNMNQRVRFRTTAQCTQYLVILPSIYS